MRDNCLCLLYATWKRYPAVTQQLKEVHRSKRLFFFFDHGFRRENFSVTVNFPSKLKPVLIGHKQEGNVIF